MPTWGRRIRLVPDLARRTMCRACGIQATLALLVSPRVASSRGVPWIGLARYAWARTRQRGFHELGELLSDGGLQVRSGDERLRR